jgi:hypothetical protein
MGNNEINGRAASANTTPRRYARAGTYGELRQLEALAKRRKAKKKGK